MNQAVAIPFVVLVEVAPWSNFDGDIGEPEVIGGWHYLSTGRYITGPSDSPGSQVFLPYLRGNITYASEAGLDIWEAGGGKSSLGSIDIDNTEGQLTPWLSEPWRDRVVTIKHGLITDAYADFEVAAVGVVDAISAPDMHTLRLTLRDKGALMEVPLQRELYPALDQAPSLEGTPRPITIGEAFGVPLTMVDSGDLLYDVHDTDSMDDTLAVYDKGELLTEGAQWDSFVTGDVFGVQRLTNPAGKQVATVRGQKDPGSDTLIEYLPEWIDEIIRRRNALLLPLGDVHMSVAELDTDFHAALNWHNRDSTTFANHLTQLLGSYLGWWFYDRLGKLRVGRLIDPDTEGVGEEVATLDRYNLVGTIAYEDDTAPGLSSRVGYARNWSPHGSDSELEGSLFTTPAGLEFAQRLKDSQLVVETEGTLAREYDHARQQEPLPTLLRTREDAQLLANRIGGPLYGPARGFYTCAAAFDGSRPWEFEPGQVVILRDDHLDLQDGKRMVIVRREAIIGSRLVKFRLWGRAPGAVAYVPPVSSDDGGFGSEIGGLSDGGEGGGEGGGSKGG